MASPRKIIRVPSAKPTGVAAQKPPRNSSAARTGEALSKKAATPAKKGK